jgi:protein-S-isoprenylcysteine O-methyltransferase Ste14
VSSDAILKCANTICDSKKLAAHFFTGQRAGLPAPTPITTGLKTKLVFFSLWNLLFTVLVLFLPAGTFQFWRAWAFVGVTAAFSIGAVVYLYRRDPQVLARRTLRTEKIGFQKLIIFFSKAVYACCLMLSAWDFRFGWTRAHIGPVPGWLSVAALAVIAAADVWFIAVMQANPFGSSIIQVEAGQTIAAAGPYRLVRHPMYLGWIIRWFATLVALGSLVTFPAFCLTFPFSCCAC